MRGAEHVTLSVAKGLNSWIFETPLFYEGINPSYSAIEFFY